MNDEEKRKVVYLTLEEAVEKWLKLVGSRTCR